METGLMAAPQAIDVRDMLCAQALAQVAQAVARLPKGGALDVHYNAADVRRDLLAWASDRGHPAAETADGHLRLARGGQPVERS